MPPDSPVNLNSSCSVAGARPPGVKMRLWLYDLAHHAVAEAIGRGRELDRHERRGLEAIEPAAVFENLRDDPLLGDALDPVVQHHPLVVPRHEPARFGEDGIGGRAGGGELVADLVVELEDRHVRLRHDQVFVVAMIADQREAFGAARQVVAMIAGDAAGGHVDVLADEKLRTGILAVGVARVARVEVAAAVRSEAVDRVEIQRRRAKVLDRRWIGLLLADRGQVQRDVVIDELPEVGEAGGNLVVVSGDAGRIAVRHRVRKLLQRPVVDRERVEVGKHPPEHPWILVPEVPVERLPDRVTACGAVAGPGRDGVRHGGAFSVSSTTCSLSDRVQTNVGSRAASSS